MLSQALYAYQREHPALRNPPKPRIDDRIFELLNPNWKYKQKKTIKFTQEISFLTVFTFQQRYNCTTMVTSTWQ